VAAYENTATVTVLAGDSRNEVNSFSEPEKLAPVISNVDVSENFTYTAPKYSVNIIRIISQNSAGANP
jgi:alpha-L-arabinofuranosidase